MDQRSSHAARLDNGGSAHADCGCLLHDACGARRAAAHARAQAVPLDGRLVRARARGVWRRDRHLADVPRGGRRRAPLAAPRRRLRRCWRWLWWRRPFLNSDLRKRVSTRKLYLTPYFFQCPGFLSMF